MEKVRLQYIDLLKVLSIFAIISIHAFMVWQNAEVKNIPVYSFAAITRFGVPVFVMISGALLLNREIELGSFLKKKVKRLVTPFIFYYILTGLVFIFIYHASHNQLENIFAFRWYFWMILGVYLSIPVINKFIQNSTMREIEYFILLFIIASIFYQLTYYFKIEQYLYLTLFLSPLGYLVLGYYLSKKEFNISTNKMILLCIMLFAVSTIVKFMGVMDILPMTDNFVASQSKILSSWLDVGIFEILQSASLFLLCKNIYESKTGIFSSIKRGLQSNILSKFILSVSRASYGMYLINLIPVYIYYHLGVALTGTQVCIAIFTLSLMTFILSWIVVVIFGKIPFIKKVSGYD